MTPVLAVAPRALFVPVLGRRHHVIQLVGRPERPTLVFLHQALGNTRLWRDFPAALCAATGCPGLVWDRLGFGESDPEPGPRTVDYLHRDAQCLLPGLLSELGITRVVPVGHSDGGTIGFLFAAARPELAAAVIAEAPHVWVEARNLAGIRQAVASYESGELKGRLARYHGQRTESIFRAWSDTWTAPWFRDWSMTAELGAVSCPVLALQGEDDEYGTPAQLAVIAGGVRGPVTTRLIPDCGHTPHHEARAEVLAAMAAFVGQCTSGGAVGPQPPAAW